MNLNYKYAIFAPRPTCLSQGALEPDKMDEVKLRRVRGLKTKLDNSPIQRVSGENNDPL